MSALDQLKTDFAFEIRSRGKEYFLDNQVELERCEPGLLRSHVNGGERYRVVVRWDGGGVAYSCTCPFFQDRDEPCKHIWASLLEADHDGVLEIAARRLETGPKSTRLVNGESPNGNGPNKRLSLWQMQIARVRERVAGRSDPTELAEQWPDDRRILYAIDVDRTTQMLDGSLAIRLLTQKMTKAGKWGEPRRFQQTVEQWVSAADPVDRAVARLVVGASRDFFLSPDQAVVDLPPFSLDSILRQMIDSGRCHLWVGESLKPTPLIWDDGPPLKFTIDVRPDEHSHGHRVVPCVKREGLIDVAIPLSEVSICSCGGHHAAERGLGYVVLNDRVARLDTAGAWPLLTELHKHDELVVPANETEKLVGELLSLPTIPYLSLPANMGIETVNMEPRPELRIHPPRDADPAAGPPGSGPQMLPCEVWFDYTGDGATDGTRVASHEARAVVFDAPRKRLVRRDRAGEMRRMDELMKLDFRHDRNANDVATPGMLLPADKLAMSVIELNRRGWRVEARGTLYRTASRADLQVKSGIDWFDLSLDLNFDGVKVPTPELLKALRSGQRMVALDDGTIGVLPDEWLARYSAVLEIGDLTDEGTVRFTKNQTALLDAMLRALPEARIDEVFAKARGELSDFAGITPLDPPATFSGTLREYQREGLGWLAFLEKFRFGGCLADDMGLGKTIQVLGMLESRRGSTPRRTSLVVVPRSLVFNWISEAKKFTPKLKVYDHSGLDRLKSAEAFGNHDLIVTTYGTMRRDIGLMREFEFDYVILDESQAIKNAATASAKSVRLLRSKHRLAMSGTPVENHLGELWSLFDFLNPGMLGSGGLFKSLGTSGSASVEARQLIAGAVRPFILRRTKTQVAKELPDRVEQTIFCEMEEEQRKLYDELKDHYRISLLGRAEVEGGRATMQVLEALLRLRQAACHPALIDPNRLHQSSAKFETLLGQIQEITAGGGKALVFSQFTSLLGLLKPKLDEQGVVYEYLDGQTRDRQARVERFQSDPECRLFLISLKAGGVGLNLTAAEYVFLLDPWWNPAVEAQAIDRAHRIGQTKTVFAYRLIAKDTIEEKVLQLQSSKRELADAIINEDNSLIRGLTGEELRTLLS